MLRKINLEHILFLDIETVPEEKAFKDLSEARKKLWEEKTVYKRKDEFSTEEYYLR